MVIPMIRETVSLKVGDPFLLPSGKPVKVMALGRFDVVFVDKDGDRTSLSRVFVRRLMGERDNGR